MLSPLLCFSFFFFNDTATTEIYTLSLHDALPILCCMIGVGTGIRGLLKQRRASKGQRLTAFVGTILSLITLDRKSTRLNSSHANISYAVFCLKKKKEHSQTHHSVLGSCSAGPREP